MRSEYRSHFAKSSSKPQSTASPRISSGPTIPSMQAVTQYHIRKSANDMIAANAVAIPTARTHQSPKKTTVTRTTYSIVKTPNVSVVHADPFTGVPSANISQSARGAAFSRTATSVVPLSARTTVPVRCASAAKERVLQTKVENLYARNRELELQVLQLKREVMMIKAGTTSQSRLEARSQPRNHHSKSCERPLSSSSSAHPLHRSAQPAPMSRIPAQPDISQQHALHLIDELRDTLVHSATDVSTSQVRPTHAKKASRKKKINKSTGLAQHQQEFYSEDVHAPPVSHTQEHRLAYEDSPINRDDDFEALQMSYWRQSQAILQELDRKLRKVTSR